MRRVILITGGTGLIGARLASELLVSNSYDRVILPVRANSDNQATGRALGALETALDRPLSPEARGRVDACKADITAPYLGLGRDRYESLAREVTHIVHGAASTSFSQSVETATHVNLNGTEAVTRFAKAACRYGRLRMFAHISTAYVNQSSKALIREEALDENPVFHNAYERSKWEAEGRIRTLRDQMPVIILRPSIVAGDSRTGAAVTFATLYVPIRLLCDGVISELPRSSGGRLDIVPVDYAAEVIAHLISAPDVAGKTFHVTAGPEGLVSSGELTAMIMRYLGSRHDVIDALSGRGVTASAAAHRASANRLARPLRTLEAYYSGDWRFDMTNTMSGLAGSTIRCPRLSEYLPVLLDYYLRCRIRPPLSKVA